MGLKRQIISVVFVLAALAFPVLAAAAEYRGQITYGGFAVPGATVTVTQGTTKLTTISDQGGLYSFPDLSDGAWTIEIEMLCFAPLHGEVNISANTSAGKWELTLLPLDAIARLTTLPPAPLPALAPAKKPAAAANDSPLEIPKPAEDESQRAADGLLVNGSVNNAATSRYSLDQAFGNRRYNSKSLYNGGLAAIIDNSALDARPYSLSGLNTPKASYNRITGVLTLGGPIKIPHLLPHGPNFFFAYQWTRDRTAETASGLVPTEAERSGDLSGLPLVIDNPMTGQPFPGNIVPVSTAAEALLQLYPAPDIAANSLYNYQAPILNSSHQDALQSRLDKTLGRKDELYGSFNFQSIRGSDGDLFGFTDKTDTLGMNTNINWSHRFSQRLFIYAGYRFSRFRTNTVPYFAKRSNISGQAGISRQQPGPRQLGSAHARFLERPHFPHRSK